MAARARHHRVRRALFTLGRRSRSSALRSSSRCSGRSRTRTRGKLLHWRTCSCFTSGPGACWRTSRSEDGGLGPPHISIVTILITCGGVEVPGTEARVADGRGARRLARVGRALPEDRARLHCVTTGALRRQRHIRRSSRCLRSHLDRRARRACRPREPRVGPRVWAALAWTFHAGILATMWIGFFYPLSGVSAAVAPPAEKISEWVNGLDVAAWMQGSKAPS